MPRQIDPDSFGFLITDTSRLIRAEMDRRIAEAGLGVTAGEGRALSQAARAGVVRQTVLAERMGVEAMTLTTYLDRLEARGLIERRTDPTDRRANLVHLTPKADDVLVRMQEIGAALRADVARDIPAADWDHLLATLKVARTTLAGMRADTILRESSAA
ncbi:MAG: MarR family transcriptional regulator [Mesorhizobium sp.]|nr:MarR family transcriptional regulator [Mesorhizobium sp.]